MRVGRSLEALPKGREWSGGLNRGSVSHPEGKRVLGRNSWRDGSGREAMQEGREWSGGPAGGPGVVGRPFRWAGSGQEALREGREKSGALQEGQD